MTKHMNKIDKLIAELCPEGVEYKELGEIGKVSMCKRIFKNETSSAGLIPFYKIGTFGKKPDAFISEQLFNDYRNKYSFPQKGDVLLSASGTIGRRVIYDGKPAYFQDSNIIWLEHDENTVLNKFLYHFYAIVKWQTEGGTIQRLYNDNFKKIKIPIPPHPIQEEIVKILDTFSALEAKLKAELEAELVARKKQYEYYQDELLSVHDGVEFKELGDVCEKTSNIKWQENKNTSFQYIDLSSVDRNTNLVTETKMITSETAPSRAQQIVKTGDIIFGTTRPTLKRFCVIKREYNEQICSTGFCVLRPKTEIVLTNYIFHFISASDFYAYVESNQKGASYPAISDSVVKKYKIPIPPLAEQERIVTILDKFDALVNDISIGLPAEISARRNQYEYYRNKLLTFKPLEKNHAG